MSSSTQDLSNTFKDRTRLLSLRVTIPAMGHPSLGARQGTETHQGLVHASGQLGTLCVLLVAVCLTLLSSAAFPAEADPLSVGIFPRRPAAATMMRFTPLARYLETRLGRPVVLSTAPDFSAFWQRLSRGRYDLVHLNQYQYVKAHALFGFRAIASNQEAGKDTITAALWTRKDSGIYTIYDLRGRVLVFGGGHTAMIAHIAARDLLQRAGIPDTTYLSRYTRHPVTAIESIYYHQGDAAGMGEEIARLPSSRSDIDLNQLKIVARNEPLAHLPWAVSPTVTETSSADITLALVSLGQSAEGRAILEQAGLTGINPANDDDYAPHRAMIERVLGERY